MEIEFSKKLTLNMAVAVRFVSAGSPIAELQAALRAAGGIDEG